MRFVPPLVLMAIIFWLSDQPGLSSGLSWDFYLRKCAHMLLFGLLWWLWVRALSNQRLRWPTLIVVLYAISDEIHQHYVPQRSGSPRDVAIDVVGVTLSWLLWRWHRHNQP